MRFRLPDPLLLIPLFRDVGDTAKRLDHLLSATRSSSVDPLLLAPHGGQPTELRRLCFFQCGPGFPRSFSLRDTAWCRFSAMGAARARSHSSLRWTHFYSPRLIDEGPALHSRFHAQAYWATRYRNSGSTAKGRIRVSTGSANIVIWSAPRLPRNRDPSDRWRTCRGSKPIRRAQVASAATASSDSTIFPRSRGVPCSGPFPSMAVMPSAITKWIGTVAQISRMLS